MAGHCVVGHGMLELGMLGGWGQLPHPPTPLQKNNYHTKQLLKIMSTNTEQLKSHERERQNHKYAQVAWMIEDITGMFNITEEQAHQFLINNTRRLQDSMIEHGFNAIETLGGEEGFEPRTEPEGLDTCMWAEAEKSAGLLCYQALKATWTADDMGWILGKEPERAPGSNELPMDMIWCGQCRSSGYVHEKIEHDEGCVQGVMYAAMQVWEKEHQPIEVAARFPPVD